MRKSGEGRKNYCPKTLNQDNRDIYTLECLNLHNFRMATNLGIFCKELILGLVIVLFLYTTFRIINDD